MVAVQRSSSVWTYITQEFIFWIKSILELDNKALHFFILRTIWVLLIISLIVIIVYPVNRPVKRLDDLPQMKIMTQYSETLVKWFAIEVDKIQKLQLRDGEITEMERLTRAREEIRKALAKFRNESFKLFTSGEVDLSLVEDVNAAEAAEGQ